MDAEPKLLLDARQWPWPVILALVGAACVLAYAFPELKGGEFLPTAFMMAGCIEWAWKRQAFFAFKREEDTFIFWFALFMLSVFLLFSLLMFYAKLVSP